ncbi:MAG: DNA-3-methyladenine glycosylase 2 family protein [Caldilineaceae bacterium]|nr:DNA-3-methyladenine glycosylase 2 family protein [Caldilineaceae bacterium]
MLTEELLSQAVAELAARDDDLARVVTRHGAPPLWAREPGFPTLILLILEQQVSLASARAAFTRLQDRLGTVNPTGLLALTDDELRAVGFSRQKTGYARHLAQAMVDGRFDPDLLPAQDDDTVRAELIKLKGIGPWTADIYLLMVLRRPDVWPAGDLALATAAQQVKGLATRPTPQELVELAEGWRPWRAVAARLLWHHYLSNGRGA